MSDSNKLRIKDDAHLTNKNPNKKERSFLLGLNLELINSKRYFNERIPILKLK
jgi:hypothetical protein